MGKTVIATPTAPAAVGPYSQAVSFGHLVFAAGQVGIRPSDGRLVEGGVVEETRQALTNLGAVLEAAGSGLEQVVKTTVFLTDMAEFQRMNHVYAEFFPSEPPARSTVQVVQLPLGARVEIEAVAALREATEARPES